MLVGQFSNTVVTCQKNYYSDKAEKFYVTLRTEFEKYSQQFQVTTEQELSEGQLYPLDGNVEITFSYFNGKANTRLLDKGLAFVPVKVKLQAEKSEA